MSRTIRCVKLGIDAVGLDRPPLPGALGQRIYEQVSVEAWQQWIAHQTRVINEYRLSLADASARKFLAQEMEKFFFGGQLTETHYQPPPAE
jgi:Fe-S cluster biosynthesis and repair protein YggX